MNDKLVEQVLSKKKNTRDSNMGMINNKIISIINEIYRPYELFKNNCTNKQNCFNTLLNNYQYYIPNHNVLVAGDYIRYISKNIKIGNNLFIKLGGFLLDEDDKNIRIINNNRILKISKADNYIFRKLTKNDIFRLSISEQFN